MVGEISDAEPKDSSLLSNIFHVAKETYYKNLSLSQEKALRETLKELNEVIGDKDVREKISIAVISSKNFSVRMGKVGAIKVFLLSDGKVADIGKEVEMSGSRFFRNVVTGKMKKKDKIAILTSEIHEPFLKEKILEQISTSSMDETIMENISSSQKKKFPEVSGVSMIIDYDINIKEGEKLISSSKEKFSFMGVFTPLFSRLALKLNSSSKNKKKGKEEESFFRKIPKVNNIFKMRGSLFFLGAALVAIILTGTLFVRMEEKSRENRQKEVLMEITDKALRAEVMISEGEKEKAFFLLKEAEEEISPMFKERTRLLHQIEETEKKIKEGLYLLSKRELSAEPIFVIETDVNPDKISFLENSLYLFSSSKVLIIDLPEKEQSSISLEREFSLISPSLNGVIALSLPEIITIKDKKMSASVIDVPEETQISSLSSFAGNPYLLTKEGEILVCKNGKCSAWIKEGEKRFSEAKSMSIDGSIFILDKENRLHRYHTGEYEEEISFLIYPSSTLVEKIYTAPGLPVFLLEPINKRVIVLSKEGEIIKQIYYENLNNIKDFAVSSDGKKIYLLNDQEVYSFEL